MVVPPSCIVIGTLGNILTLITVTSKHCKKNSFVVYLGALALADTTFLYGAALNGWLFFAYDIDVMLSAVSCKVFGFLLHACKMWSSLSVAALTADRAVCTRFPLKRNTFCTPTSAMIVSGLIIGFVVAMNAHELYGFKLNTVENATFCGYIDDAYGTFFDVYFRWIDASFYFILPCIVIIVSNIITVREVIIATKTTSHMMHAETVRARIRNNRQMIVTVVTVSVAFLFLTFPTGILVIIRPYIFDDTETFYHHADLDFLMTTIGYILSILNVSINFFLYVISAKRFREDLKAAFGCFRRSRVAPAS